MERASPLQGSGKDLHGYHQLPRSQLGSYLFKAAGEQEIRYHYLLAAFTPRRITAFTRSAMPPALAVPSIRRAISASASPGIGAPGRMRPPTSPTP
jgi:hypothetical protein